MTPHEARPQQRFLRIALAQLHTIAADLTGNSAKIRAAVKTAHDAGADILLTPELAVSGYTVEDLLGERAFLADTEGTVRELAAAAPEDLLVVLGTPMTTQALPEAGGARLTGPGQLDAHPRSVRNAAVLAHAGQIVAAHSKTFLPTYGVFDEARFFVPGPAADQDTFLVSGVRVAVAICEDVWRDEVADAASEAGAQVLLVLNASPYHRGKPSERLALLTRLARRTGMVVAYCAAVGGQDETCLDGGSLVLAADGRLLAQAPLFQEGTFVVDVPVPVAPDGDAAAGAGRLAWRTALATGALRSPAEPVRASWPTDEGEVYAALVRGLHDYVEDNGFPGVLLALSGGLDSALAATIAVDALGSGRVRGVGMPGPYSSEGSVADARALAENLGIRFDVVPITDTYEAELGLLGPLLDGPGVTVAKENIQARLRGLHLMTLSNATGAMMVNTGNRSEAAVGYFTLGGDSMGGFAPLKDVPKTMAYALTEWRNARAEAVGQVPPIPAATLSKPPSAELAPDQVDSDSLPPYPVLDAVLAAHLEELATPVEIAALLTAEHGLDPDAAADVVGRVLRMVDRAEHKRRQVAPGIKVTRRAFGRDRRVPITSGRVYR